jgi:hypothetical protein
MGPTLTHSSSNYPKERQKKKKEMGKILPPAAVPPVKVYLLLYFGSRWFMIPIPV